MSTRERVQWTCEVLGLLAAVVGVVLVGAAVGGLLGAGTALVVAGALLLALGNTGPAGGES